jgi:hypothetical protein
MVVLVERLTSFIDVTDMLSSLQYREYETGARGHEVSLIGRVFIVYF